MVGTPEMFIFRDPRRSAVEELETLPGVLSLQTVVILSSVVEATGVVWIIFEMNLFHYS